MPNIFDMVRARLKKDENVVQVNECNLPLRRGSENVFRPPKGCRGVFRLERHPGVPMQAMMGRICFFVPVALVALDTPVRKVVAKRITYHLLSQIANAFDYAERRYESQIVT